MAKFDAAVRAKLPGARAEQVMALVDQPEALEATPITELIAMYHG